MAPETLLMARKFIPYSRFSGKRQSAGESEDRQASMIAQAAAAEKLPIDETLCLKDKGLSAFRGKNWKRGDLGKFLDLVDAGVIPAGSVLGVERVNRLSRMPWMKQVELWKEILSRGIIIRTCEPPGRYTASNMDDLAIGCPVVIHMMLAHAESKQKSEWSFHAAETRRQKARDEGTPHHGSTPPWVRVVSKPHPQNPARRVFLSYAVDEHRAAILRWMHQARKKDRVHTRSAMNSSAKAKNPGERKRHGARAAIRYYLTSRQAVGEWQPTKLDAEGVRRPQVAAVRDHYPAIITEACWQETQRARRKRRGKGGRHRERNTNLFTHLVYDAAAGEAVHTIPQGLGEVPLHLPDNRNTTVDDTLPAL